MAFADLMAIGDLAVRQQLGEPLIYTPGRGHGSPVTVQGIFDSAYVVEDASTGQAGISTSGPAAFFTLTDLTSDPYVDEGATVTRVSTGEVFTQHEAKHDGMGTVVMLLHLV